MAPEQAALSGEDPHALAPIAPTSAPPEAAYLAPLLDAALGNVVGNLASAPADTLPSSNIPDAAQRVDADGKGHHIRHIAYDADYNLLIQPSRKNDLFYYPIEMGGG